jgi:ribosomal protein S9
MSTTTTITKPAPVIEGSLTAFLKSIDKLGAGAVPSTFTGIDTTAYDPQVAAQDALQKKAVADAAGLGALTGPQAYQPFMSPYQQEVIDATLSEFDRNQAIQNTGMRDQAIAAGAYGGGREGVMAAEAAKGAAMNRTQLQAQLLNQGFQQAQQAAAADLQAQQGLGGYQSQLGQQQQAFAQAGLDAAQIAAREKEFQPFTQLGLIGQQLAQIQPGAFPTQTVGYAPPAAPASPMSQFLGGAAGIAGIGGKLGLFG